jgi:hypothetical protein
VSATPEMVAEWMLNELKRENCLYQEDAVHAIVEKFGGDFSYYNENGNPAIRRDVLKAFKKLSEELVVWERGERMWRMRESGDEPGRGQY